MWWGSDLDLSKCVIERGNEQVDEHHSDQHIVANLETTRFKEKKSAFDSWWHPQCFARTGKIIGLGCIVNSRDIGLQDPNWHIANGLWQTYPHWMPKT